MDQSVDATLLEGLIRAAVKAGGAIETVRRKGLEIRNKRDASPVTSADLAAEAVILQCLAELAPAVPVVAEEKASLGEATESAREFFLVDPLDGTREFILGREDFTVNIALVRSGAPVLGVVYAPARAQLYAGHVAQRFAFRMSQEPDGLHAGSRQPIQVRRPPTSGVIAVASHSHRNPNTDQYLARLPVRNTVSVGSSLKFCWVADGQADVYPRLGTTMEWDTAAGQAVLVAAGGDVRTSNGARLGYGKPEFRNPWFVATAEAFVPFVNVS